MSKPQRIRIVKKPLPPKKEPLPPLPLEKMLISEAFTLKINGQSDKAAIRQRIHRFQIANPPAKFSMRKIDEHTVEIQRVRDVE